MMKNNNVYKYLFIFYSLVVLVLTVYPRINLPIDPKGFSVDKLAHSAQFIIFSFLYYKMRKSMKQTRRVIIIELFFLGTLISPVLESLQLYIPGRSFEWWDIASNLFGFYLFIIFEILIAVFKGNKQRTAESL